MSGASALPAAPAAAQPARRGRVGTVALWAVQVVLAAVFAGAGAAKLAADPAMVTMFDAIGAGQGLRLLVGALEVAGAVGLLVPRLAGLAALGLALLMVGATVTNLAVLDTGVGLTVALAVVAAAVAWLRLVRRAPARRAR